MRFGHSTVPVGHFGDFLRVTVRIVASLSTLVGQDEPQFVLFSAHLLRPWVGPSLT